MCHTKRKTVLLVTDTVIHLVILQNTAHIVWCSIDFIAAHISTARNSKWKKNGLEALLNRFFSKNQDSDNDHHIEIRSFLIKDHPEITHPFQPCGVHSWEGNQHLSMCEHGEREKQQKWLKWDSPTFMVVKNIVKNDERLDDLKYLSKFSHTKFIVLGWLSHNLQSWLMNVVKSAWNFNSPSCCSLPIV